MSWNCQAENGPASDFFFFFCFLHKSFFLLKIQPSVVKWSTTGYLRAFGRISNCLSIHRSYESLKEKARWKCPAAAASGGDGGDVVAGAVVIFSARLWDGSWPRGPGVRSSLDVGEAVVSEEAEGIQRLHLKINWIPKTPFDYENNKSTAKKKRCHADQDRLASAGRFCHTAFVVKPPSGGKKQERGFGFRREESQDGVLLFF